jgi:hypothetical protein
MDKRLHAYLKENAEKEGLTVDQYFDQLVAEGLVIATREGVRLGLGGKDRADELCIFAVNVVTRPTWLWLVPEMARKHGVPVEELISSLQIVIIERVVGGSLS